MVFKGKYNSYKQNKLNKIDLVANMNIYVVCQENPWVTNDIFGYWIDNILFHMENLLIENHLNY